MALSKRDQANAKHLRRMVSAVKDIKALLAARRPIPKITLEVDPVWCRENPGEAARKINRLADALYRALAHCDAAKHKGNAYRDERDAILEALRSPKISREH